MVSLQEIQKAAADLSDEDRAGLVTHLLASFAMAPSGPDDDELDAGMRKWMRAPCSP